MGGVAIITIRIIGQILRIMIARRVHRIQFLLKQERSLNVLLILITLKILVIMEKKKHLFLL